MSAPDPPASELPTLPPATSLAWWEPGTPGDSESYLSLAELIERLGAGVERFDEAFAREVGRALHERARHVRIPAVDRLALADVLVTLSMDRAMRLIVTGALPDVRAQVTLRWEERDFPYLPLVLSATPGDPDDAYTFATLDFSVRGKQATLVAAASPLPAGQAVTIRALSTIGETTEYRVSALGLDLSVPFEAVTLL